MIGSDGNSLSSKKEVLAPNEWQYSKIVEKIGNSKANKKMKRNSRDKAPTKEETEHSTVSDSQDFVESSQPHQFSGRKSRLGKHHSETKIVVELSGKLGEVLPDNPQLRLESREETSEDDFIVGRGKRKAKEKESVECSVRNRIDHRVKSSHNDLEEAAKTKRKNTSTTVLTDVFLPVKKKRMNALDDSLERVESKQFSGGEDSVQMTNSGLEVLEKGRKAKKKQKVKKMGRNTLLSMIRDSSNSSESDDKHSSVKSLHKSNLRKRSKTKVVQAIDTSDEEEECQSSETKLLRNVFSPSKQGNALNKYRLQGNDSEKNCLKGEKKSLGREKPVKTETLSTDIDSSTESANISIKNLTTKSALLREDSERKEMHTIGKKKANTLLSMIHDRSNSSESDNENEKTMHGTAKSLGDTNLKQKTETRVRHMVTISDNEKESSNTKPEECFFSTLKQSKTLDDNRLKSRTRKENSSNDERKSLTLKGTKKAKKLVTDTDSSSDSANVSVENSMSKFALLKQDTNDKRNLRVNKKRSSTLLSMIRDESNSSESDDENDNIVATSAKSLDNAKLRKRGKAKPGQIVTSSDEDEERQSSGTRLVRHFLPSAKHGKTLDDNRLKSHTSGENSKNKRKNVKREETRKTEKLSRDIYTSSESESISLEDSTSKTALMRQNTKCRGSQKVDNERFHTLLSMIGDSSNSSESDHENNKSADSSAKPMDHATLRRRNSSRVSQTVATNVEDKEHGSLGTESLKNVFASSKHGKTLNDDWSKGHKCEKNCSDDDRKSRELEVTIKSEIPLMDLDSSSNSSNISAKDLKPQLKALKKDDTLTDEEKVEKKKPNKLLSMVNDSSNDSESDDEHKMTAAKYKNTKNPSSDNKNLKKSSDSKVSQTISTSNENEGYQSSTTKPVRNFVSLSKPYKTLDDYWSKSHKSNKNPSKDKPGNLKVRERLKSKNVSMDETSRCNSPNISIDDLTSEAKVLTVDKKRKAWQKIVKKESNTLLSMIDDDSSNSDCDDGRVKIENDSDGAANTTNLTKRITSDVCDTDMSSDDEYGYQCSDLKPVNLSSRIRNSDLKVEAQDLEHLISVLEDEDEVPRETLKKLRKLDVKLQHTVPPQHMVETCAGSRGPTHEQKDIIEKFGPIKYGKYTPEEDDIIVKNWKSFCKVHDWDIRDVKPFMYMRHQRTGYTAKLSERQKFVQYLANGLPWRTLYSVYWRFRNLYQPHLATRYTEDEDKLIIAHMENSSSIDTRNVRKFSELAKILNRTRASVWRRYRLLKKKKTSDHQPQYDLHLAKKLIKNLIQLTLSKDVNELKDLDIPLAVWNKLSKKFDIDNKDLKQFWLAKLHVQLFCKEPVYLNDVKIKIIEYFYVSGITEWWEIEWANIVKYFDGMTSIFLSRIFSFLIHDEKLEGKELSEIIGYLYEVKKPQLQQAATDKCLPKLVFKHGSLSLLGSEKKEKRKLRNS